MSYGFDPLVPVELSRAVLNLVYSNVFFSPYRPIVVTPPMNINTKDEPQDKPVTKLMSREDILHKVTGNMSYGVVDNASCKILQDFWGGRLGPIALQLAPTFENT